VGGAPLLLLLLLHWVRQRWFVLQYASVFCQRGETGSAGCSMTVVYVVSKLLVGCAWRANGLTSVCGFFQETPLWSSTWSAAPAAGSLGIFAHADAPRAPAAWSTNAAMMHVEPFSLRRRLRSPLSNANDACCCKSTVRRRVAGCEQTCRVVISGPGSHGLSQCALLLQCRHHRLNPPLNPDPTTKLSSPPRLDADSDAIVDVGRSRRREFWQLRAASQTAEIPAKTTFRGCAHPSTSLSSAPT
jgi:hypothetical protein